MCMCVHACVHIYHLGDYLAQSNQYTRVCHYYQWQLQLQLFLLYQSFILIHRGFIHTYPAWGLVNFSNLGIHVLLILKNSWLLSLFSLKFLSGTGCYINFYAQSFWPHENGIDSYSPTILSTGLECHFSQETHFLPFNSQPKTTLSLITANGKSFSHTLFTERAFFRFPHLLDSLGSSSPLGICPNCISCKSARRFSTYKGMQHSYVYHSGF